LSEGLPSSAALCAPMPPFAHPQSISRVWCVWYPKGWPPRAEDRQTSSSRSVPGGGNLGSLPEDGRNHRRCKNIRLQSPPVQSAMTKPLPYTRLNPMAASCTMVPAVFEGQVLNLALPWLIHLLCPRGRNEWQFQAASDELRHLYSPPAFLRRWSAYRDGSAQQS
jgi:hypothetical protein